MTTMEEIVVVIMVLIMGVITVMIMMVIMVVHSEGKVMGMVKAGRVLEI